MVIYFDDLETEKLSSPRGGCGTGEAFIFDKIVGMGGKIKAFNMMVLDADSEIGYHQHTNDWEAYLLLDGSGSYNDNGEVVNVKEGDLMICKKGESHGIKSLDGKEIYFLAFIME